MKKLRWGVIGAGGIADRRTIPGMMLANNAELIAVMEINMELAEKSRAKWGCKRAYDSEAALLADPEIDAVYIASPVVLHAKQAMMAADAGKHILIEKPLAMTSEEGQKVVDYCESKGVKIAAGLMMRFGAYVMAMKQAIADGKIGRPVSGFSQFTCWYPDMPNCWRQQKQNGGGGMGGKMSPSAVLVIQNGTTKLVNVKNQDGITKVLDMVPDFVNKFTSKDKEPSEGEKKAAKEMEEILTDAVNPSEE